MKKILAGILASTSLLAMTVSASAAAADKTVTKAGEVSYDVAVTAPKIVLDLVMPAKMAAALNPYGADLKLDLGGDEEDPADDITTTAGIASVAYTITNNSLDYGVYFDATAVTTVTTSDEKPWSVTNTAVADGTKSAQMALVVAEDAGAIKTIAEDAAGIPTASAAYDATAKKGILVMDSTEKEDAKTGKVAGQTSQKKFMYLEAATPGATDADPATPKTAAMAFIGKLAQSSATVDVEWKEDDAINVNLVLKVAAGPKGATTSNRYVGLTALSVNKTSDGNSGGDTGEKITDFDAATNTYSISGCHGFDAYTITATPTTGGTAVMAAAAGSLTGGAAGSFTPGTGAVSIGNSLPASVTITVTDGTDPSKTDTYTVTFTA